MFRCELNPYSRLTLSKSSGFESESSSAIYHGKEKKMCQCARWISLLLIVISIHRLTIDFDVYLQENSNDSFIILDFNELNDVDG